ncbi:MAG: hypothetical protein LBG94_00750 [Treponema sp.]|jgi:hypothetical protein|nr:hypothetical protein [Treponema sp.]
MHAVCLRKKGIKPAVLVLLFIIPFLTLNAQSFKDNFHWAVMGSLFHIAANNGVDSDPAPILPSLGASFAWQFWGPLRIEITEDIYFTNYEYNTELGYPMACNPENRSAFVLGFLTGIQLTAFIPIGSAGFAGRFSIGPAIDLRVVTLAFGLKHPADFQGDERDAQIQTDAIRKYFWSKGRWFIPTAGIGADFPVNRKFSLGFDFRVWVPVYKLWTNEEFIKIDGWRFGLGFRITPRKTPSPANP